MSPRLRAQNMTAGQSPTPNRYAGSSWSCSAIASKKKVLQSLLDEQQDKSSANFHAWQSPEEFGKRFGPADADIQTLTQWLMAHGFTEIRVAAGRTVIEFSGNVTSVRKAFHTAISPVCSEW